MSNIIDGDKLQKIFEAAEKVPYGPWEYHPRAWEYRNDDLDKSEYGVFTPYRDCLVDDGSAWGEYSPVASKEILQYFALLDRDTVTAMVDRIQELEHMCVWLANTCNDFEENIYWRYGKRDKRYFEPTDWFEKAKEAVRSKNPVDSPAK